MNHDLLTPGLDPHPQPHRKGQWTPCRSRARLALIKRGLTYSRIAVLLRQQGLPASPAAVARVVHGHTRTEAIRATIAKLVGKSVEQLWPEEQAS